MQFIRCVTLCLLLLPTLAQAQVTDRAYGRAVDLVHRLYLYPDEVEAPEMLHGSAQGLADHVDWLLVETQGNAVYLRHGTGEPIGSVSVASMETLPEALRSLESLVVEAGYDLDGVDVRLEILKGMTRALDRYSRILAGERLERFDVRLKGTLVGIGATLRLTDDGLRVQELVPEGPAERGGLMVGDLIGRVDGVSTTNMPLKEATRRIRGEEGTEVALSVQRGEHRLELAFVRAEVVIANVRHRVLEGGIGYIQITHFSQRTVDNLATALDELRAEGGADRGLVIDLRGNTGGSMKEAARSADQFLTQGMLLRTAGPDGGQVQNLQARMDARDDRNEPPVPVVVLMDRRTASGSEILAGALLELDRAVLIGTRSYGKGTVQKIYNLDDETRLKLTVAQYLLAGDRSIAAGGLIPDVALAEVELSENGVRYGGWSPSSAGKDREAIVPVVVEKRGWRGQPYVSEDVALELGRRTVLAAEGPAREQVLAALAQVEPGLRAEQETHLALALAGGGIDWAPHPEPADAVEPPYAEVAVRAEPDPERPDTYVVYADVTNHADVPLYRAQVELVCDTFSLWSGVAIPVGRVAPGAKASGEARIELRPGVSLREDVVAVKLRAEGHSELYVRQELFRARSSDVPRVAVLAQLRGEGAARTAHVTVRNLSTEPLTGIEVFFEAPGDMDVELIDRAARIATLEANGQAELDLSVSVGPQAPVVLPMHLVVESDQTRLVGRLAEWPVDLPLNGALVSLEAPHIDVPAYALAAPMGRYEVTVAARDDGVLQHLVLYRDGHKVAWTDGGGPEIAMKAAVELDYGPNRLTAITVDDQGLEQQFTFVVRGEAEAAVDATVDEP